MQDVRPSNPGRSPDSPPPYATDDRAVLPLLAVTGGTVLGLAMLAFALWTHDTWRRRHERRGRDVPPLAVLATKPDEDDPRHLEAIENDLVAGLIAGDLPPGAYAEAMAWLADREERFGLTESTLPPSFRADA